MRNRFTGNAKWTKQYSFDNYGRHEQWYSTQYSEWTVGPFSSAMCSPMFMQFTGRHEPVRHYYWPENAIDWLRECILWYSMGLWIFLSLQTKSS